MVHQNREVATPLSTITLMDLSSIIREAGLSSAKVWPARTSYCAVFNAIYFTIYFMRGAEEKANGTRIIPSLVTPPTPIMLISYRLRDLC